MHSLLHQEARDRIAARATEIKYATAARQIIGEAGARFRALQTVLRGSHKGVRALLELSPDAVRLSFPKPQTAGFESNS